MYCSKKNIDDYWNVVEDRELSDTWRGFTRFTMLNETPPDGFSWSGRRLTKRQTTSRPDHLWPEIWKNMSDAAQRTEKQKWAIEKPKLDTARNLCGIYFIDPDDDDDDDDEFKRIMKNARRKLEVPMPAAVLCRTRREEFWETCCVLDNRKTKYACIVEAEESRRERMEGSHHKSLEDHIAEGIQGPLNQRSDFEEAKQTCERLYHEYTAITGSGNKPVPPGQQVRQRLDQQFEGLEEYDYRLEASTGWRDYPSCKYSQLHLNVKHDH